MLKSKKIFIYIILIVGLMFNFGCSKESDLNPFSPDYSGPTENELLEDGFNIYNAYVNGTADESDLSDALDDFTGALDANPMSYQAHIGKALINIKLGNIETAMNYFDEVTMSPEMNTALMADIPYMRILYYGKAELYALEYNNRSSAMQLLETLVYGGGTDITIEEWAFEYDSTISSANILALLAELYFYEGYYSEADVLVTQALAWDPDNERANNIDQLLSEL